MARAYRGAGYTDTFVGNVKRWVCLRCQADPLVPDQPTDEYAARYWAGQVKRCQTSEYIGVKPRLPVTGADR